MVDDVEVERRRNPRETGTQQRLRDLAVLGDQRPELPRFAPLAAEVQKIGAIAKSSGAGTN